MASRGSETAAVEEEEREAKQNDPEEVEYRSGPPILWSPLVFRKPILSSFIAVFVSILAALVALFCVSQKYQGLTTVNTNRGSQYVWTYGPTAVFVLLGAFWGVVQYRATQLMPWFLMSRSYVSAPHSLLLDYISPWNVLSLFRALKHKHFLVVFAISGTLVIKILVVLSTAIFAIRDIEIVSKRSFVATTSFSNTAFFPGSNATWISMLQDYRPLLNALALHENVSETIGSNFNYVYQTFHESSAAQQTATVANQTSRAVVDVVTVDVRCEEASSTTHIYTPADALNQTYLDATNQTLSELTQYYYTLSAQNCSYTNSLHRTSGGYDGLGFGYGLMPCQGVFDVPPDGIPDTSYQQPMTTSACYVYPASQQDIRLWAWLVYDTYQPVTVTAAIMCTVSYKTNRGLVTIEQSPALPQPVSNVELKDPITIAALENVTGGHILTATYCINQYSGTGSQDKILAKERVTGYGSYELSPLTDIGTLLSQAEQMTTRFVAQMIKAHLMSPSDSPIAGFIVKEEARLVVQSLSFGLTAGALTVGALLTVMLLLLYSPMRVCSRDPSSIGGLATILARSSGPSEVMVGMGWKRTRELRQVLQEYCYRTRSDPDGSFMVDQHQYTTSNDATEEAISNIATSNNEDHESSTGVDGEPDSERRNSQGEDHEVANTHGLAKKHWWQPFSITAISFSIIMLVTGATISALSVLLHFSNKSDGIVGVDAKSNQRYAWRFIPVLAIFGVQTLFEQLYSAIRTLHPYYQLLQTHAQRTVITENQQRKMAVWGFLSASKNRQWPVVFAILPMLLSPLLPIFIAGLFAPADTVRTELVKLTSLTTFELSSLINGPNGIPEYSLYYAWNYLFPFAQNAAGELVLTFNMSYPQWTHGQYAFPSIEIQSTSQRLDPSWNRLSLRLPGTYVNMNCTPFPVLNEIASTGVINTQNLEFNNCRLGVYNYSLPQSGKFWDLIINSDNTDSQTVLSPTCPTMIILFGQSQPNNASTINAVKCRPKLETADFNVQFILPTLAFDLTAPPSLIDGSQGVIYDGYLNGSASVPENLNVSAISEFEPWSFIATTVIESALYDTRPGNDSDLQLLGTLGQTMVLGINGTPAVELLKNSTALIGGIQRVYGIVAAQQLNYFGRVNLTATQPSNLTVNNTANAPLLLQGELHNTSITRLHQNKTNTYVLIALLAAMAISGFVSVMLMPRANRILPKKPTKHCCYVESTCWLEDDGGECDSARV